MEIKTIVLHLCLLLAAGMGQENPVSGSCWNNCGNSVGTCSCTSSCTNDGNCCADYPDYCMTSPTQEQSQPWPTEASLASESASYDSCQNKCGYLVGSCSCTSSCFHYGNCCDDYNNYCIPPSTTELPAVTGISETAVPGSCWNNCGNSTVTCSCTITCIFDGNCCDDYSDYCPLPTTPDQTFPGGVSPLADESCMYNCGNEMADCSCTSSCLYYGNCCPDYYDYCVPLTTLPQPWTTTDAGPTTYESCMDNCGSYFGICSCMSSCPDYGNCCYDYYDYCFPTSIPSLLSPGPSEAIHPQCGGNLFRAGSFSSPYYPNYYQDDTYCVWYISAPPGQQVFLTITDIQLENCCGCDYIEVYDGPSLSSRSLGRVCYTTTMDNFHSTSSYLTVLFRSDGSVVSRGFRADYTSSLPDSAGRVNCSSDNMNIVLQTSYLRSVGYSGNDLYLNDQNCRPTVSSNQVVFSFALNTCGTRRKFNNGRIVYTNGVRAYPSQSGEITRQTHFTLQVLCRMEQDATAQIMYVAREAEMGNITGSGRFNITMAFYTSSNFIYPVYNSPYVVNLNQYLYVQVKLRRPDSSLVLFLDTCVASPSPRDFNTRSYYLVRNGCRRDSTYYEYSSGRREVARFRFQAFAFLRSHPEVYLRCTVAICRAQDNTSRCSQGCRMRKARSLRSAADSETATVILGPIQLRDPKKPEKQLPKEGVALTVV